MGDFPPRKWGCILSKAQMILTPFVRHATWYLGWSNRKNPREFSVKKQRGPRFPWFCSQLPESASRILGFFMVFYTVLHILIGAYFWGENGHISRVVLWAVGSLELGILRGNPSPPKFNIIDAKNLDFLKMYLLSNMVILGIHVSFRGCILQVTRTCGFQRAKKKHWAACRSAQKMDEESREHPKPEPLEWNLPRDIGSPAMNGAREIFMYFPTKCGALKGTPKASKIRG